MNIQTSKTKTYFCNFVVAVLSPHTFSLLLLMRRLGSQLGSLDSLCASTTGEALIFCCFRADILDYVYVPTMCRVFSQPNRFACLCLCLILKGHVSLFIGLVFFNFILFILVRMGKNTVCSKIKVIDFTVLW